MTELGIVEVGIRDVGGFLERRAHTVNRPVRASVRRRGAIFVSTMRMAGRTDAIVVAMSERWNAAGHQDDLA